MPAYGTLNVSGSAFYTATQPVVTSLSEYGSGAFVYCEVLSITTRTGILPDEAVIVIEAKDGEGPNQTTPITYPNGGELDADHLRFYSRIAINYAGERIFIGSLVKRKEDGKNNTITLTYWDDRHLLAKMPLRGCLVADPQPVSSGGQDRMTPKFIPGYVPWVNPNGYRNAQAVDVSQIAGMENVKGKFYVFSAFAEMGAENDAADTAEEGSNEEVDTVIWTPARWLNYLVLYAAWQDTYYLEGQKYHADRLRLEPFTIFDEDAHSKMNSQNFMGQTVFGAMIKGFEATGAYGLMAEPSEDVLQLGPYKRISLESGEAEEEEEHGLDIRMVRSGQVTGADTAFDFTAEADATDLITNVLVEGARDAVEAQFTFDGSPDSSTWVPEWTPQEGILYHIAINGGGTDKYSGGSVAGDGTHAVGPPTLDDLHSVNSWVSMDGTDGRPNIPKQTAAAMRFARQLFPKAWRAFRIATEKDTTGGDAVRNDILGIVPGITPGSLAAPFLNIARQPMPEQLQAYYEEINELRGRVRYPIRVQVAETAGSSVFHDVSHAAGIWSTPDGTVYFDGLTDDVGDAIDRVYDGDFLLPVTDWTTPTTDLFESANGIELRSIRINMAVRHDHRIKSYDDFIRGTAPDFNRVSDYIDESISNWENRTALTHYILSPEDYRREIQIESFPYGGVHKGDGLGELLFDTPMIYNAVLRELKKRARIDYKSTWHLVGIRPEYRAGRWLNKISFEGQGYSRKIRQAAEEVIYDFHAHETRVSAGG